MDGELVPVHHGEHRVQMHEGPGLGDVEGQHLPEGAVVGEDGLRQGVDGVLPRPLGDAHRQHLGGEHQDVAPLQGAGLAPVVPPGHVFVLGVVLKDEFAEQCLPVPGGGVHLVEGHAGADGGEGVPGEIQVGHGVHGEGVVILQVGEVVPQLSAAAPQLGLADAGHHGIHHLPVIHPLQIVLQQLPAPVVRDAGLVQELADQVLPHLPAGEGLDHQVGQVHHLHALLAQAVGKGVVLLLGLFQIGDVVEQQPFQILRHQVFQLSAGAVQQHPPQPPDLGGIMDRRLQ